MRCRRTHEQRASESQTQQALPRTKEGHALRHACPPPACRPSGQPKHPRAAPPPPTLYWLSLVSTNSWSNTAVAVKSGAGAPTRGACSRRACGAGRPRRSAAAGPGCELGAASTLASRIEASGATSNISGPMAARGAGGRMGKPLEGWRIAATGARVGQIEPSCGRCVGGWPRGSAPARIVSPTHPTVQPSPCPTHRRKANGVHVPTSRAHGHGLDGLAAHRGAGREGGRHRGGGDCGGHHGC